MAVMSAQAEGCYPAFTPVQQVSNEISSDEISFNTVGLAEIGTERPQD